MRADRPRVAVTGGAGFIGSHVVGALVEAGHPVLVVDDLSTGRSENLVGVPGVDLVRLDVADTEVADVLASFEAEVICHLTAAIDVRGEAGVISVFTDALLAGRPTTIYGDGTQTRDLVHVGDVASAFLAATGDLGDGCRFTIGTGVETTVQELHTLLADLCGAPDEPRLAPSRPGELQRSALDAGRARTTLGWTPRVPLATGLAGTVGWIRSREEVVGPVAGTVPGPR